MATTPSIYYPTGDGRPMAETPIHGDALVYLVDVLKRWFVEWLPTDAEAQKELLCRKERHAREQNTRSNGYAND